MVSLTSSVTRGVWKNDLVVCASVDGRASLWPLWLYRLSDYCLMIVGRHCVIKRGLSLLVTFITERKIVTIKLSDCSCEPLVFRFRCIIP